MYMFHSQPLKLMHVTDTAQGGVDVVELVCHRGGYVTSVRDALIALGFAKIDRRQAKELNRKVQAIQSKKVKRNSINLLTTFCKGRK